MFSEVFSCLIGKKDSIKVKIGNPKLKGVTKYDYMSLVIGEGQADLTLVSHECAGRPGYNDDCNKECGIRRLANLRSWQKL